MTQAEYEERVTPTVVREVFDNCILQPYSGKYAISVAGKIITIGGKVAFDSREQAVKAFYNSFSWRTRRTLHYHINGGDYYWWRNEDRTTMWKAFKNILRKDYDFKIITL